MTDRIGLCDGKFWLFKRLCDSIDLDKDINLHYYSRGRWFMLFSKEKLNTLNKVVAIPMSKIVPGKAQPRTVFDENEIAGLALSIVENGLLQPITVREFGDKYEIIAGERRYRAFRLLKYQTIPAIIEKFDDKNAAFLSLIENLQRKDLNFFEEARGIEKLIQNYHLTQSQAAKRLGKSQSSVANKLRLLRIDAKLADKIISAGLTERHARALLRLEDNEKLAECLEVIIEKDYNVEQTEELVEICLQEKKPKAKKQNTFVLKDIRIFLNTINKAVRMLKNAGVNIKSVQEEQDGYIKCTITVPNITTKRTKNTA